MTADDRITWAEATNLMSTQFLDVSIEWDAKVPKEVKIETTKHHHLLLHYDEEIKMLNDEMRSCWSFYLNDWKELRSTI